MPERDPRSDATGARIRERWIGMWLDGGAAWEDIDGIIGAAYESAAEEVAPKKKRAPAKKKPR